jgi:hypothetical protein
MDAIEIELGMEQWEIPRKYTPLVLKRDSREVRQISTRA